VVISGKTDSMKTIEQITDEIHAVNKWDRKHDILKKWVESIVNECAVSAIDWDQADTTIDKESILNVMKQL
jgi:hypothetical protein